MHFDILSLFPDYFQSPFNESIIKRALDKKLITINLVNIRDFAKKQRNVDDRPYGGGPGMILKAEPVVKAIRSVKESNDKAKTSHVIYLSPQGVLLNAKKCRELALKSHLILVCGHYEGIDERALEIEVQEEISIGDYVLTDGCIAAIVLLNAVARFIPGVIGDERSIEEDSFEKGILDYPHYTRPPIFEDSLVPQVLQKGNHLAIDQWRKEKAYEKTKRVRPDLLKNYLLGETDE